MLLVTRDESFEDIYNYDDIMGKVEDIPTAVIRKSDGDTIKDYIKSNPNEVTNIHMLIKFKSVYSLLITLAIKGYCKNKLLLEG